MQSLDNLRPSERKENNIPQNIGQTMKHAGVAITVTSITDIVVFAVGSSTVSRSHFSFANSKCENFRILREIIFYVKSILSRF